MSFECAWKSVKTEDFWRFRNLLEWEKRGEKHQIFLILWMIPVRKIDTIDSQLRSIFCLNGVNLLKNVGRVKGQIFSPRGYTNKTEKHVVNASCIHNQLQHNSSYHNDVMSWNLTWSKHVYKDRDTVHSITRHCTIKMILELFKITLAGSESESEFPLSGKRRNFFLVRVLLTNLTI